MKHFRFRGNDDLKDAHHTAASNDNRTDA